MTTTRIPAADVPPGSVTGAGPYAVGNNGDHFAVSRRCRHLGADLAEGTIDADGCLVDHSVNARVMSIPVESLRKAPVRVLVAGGADKPQAIAAACRLLQPTSLVTDEATAKTMTTVKV